MLRVQIFKKQHWYMPPNSFFREIKLKTLCQDYLPEVHLREVFMGCLRPSMNPQMSSVNVCGPWASETLGKAMTPRTRTLPLVLQTRSGHKQAEPTHGLRLGSCPTPQRAESLDPPYHSPTRRGFPCTTLSHTGVAWAEQCGGGGGHVERYPVLSLRAPKGLRWVFI